jgi:leucyl-tRNA synthetase
MWTKVLFDLGHIGFDEPFRKLLNQGMIQGSSRFVYRNKQNPNEFISAGLIHEYDTNPIHVDVNFVDGFELDIAAFKQWRNGEYANASFVLENGKYICGAEVEKMSKSKFNTVNPDVLVEKYGADTFRMYEMFLGPVDQSKPWDTKGIEGVHRFLKKLWRLFYDELKGKVWNEDSPNPSELKVLHKTILNIQEDTERFSFNTAVSTFMICVNELADLKCNKKAILEQVLILLTPYAPHISEELWHQLGNAGSVLDATFPVFNASYVQESTKDYPVSINGRVRTNINLPIDMEQAAAENIVLANELVQKWLEGKPVKKFIFVKGRMINVVI